MVYYEDTNIKIRRIEESDAVIICAEEVAQGYQQTIDKYLLRIEDQASGKSISLVAEYEGKVAGYINIYPDAKWGSFGGMGYPEIVDFGVLEKYRKLGIGTKLMDIAEEIAFSYSPVIYLGVGLHSGYGSAQRMYAKRGYLPDGNGAWFGKMAATPYAMYCLGDDLILYMSKKV